MYRNITYSLDKFREGKIRLDTWDEEGNPITEIHDHDSELYYESNTGEHTSMYGTKLRQLTFNSIIEKSVWRKSNRESKRIFNDLTPVREFLVNKYEGQQETTDFTKFQFRKWFLDIEIATTGEGFPESDVAEQPVNIISIFDTYLQEYHVFYTLDPKHHKDQVDLVPKGEKYHETFTKFKENRKTGEWEISGGVKYKTVYHDCRDEKTLFKEYIQFTENNYPDIISGWNVDGFDVPYICNRVINLFDQRTLERLSPIGKINGREVFDIINQKTVTEFTFEGITVMDYCFLYKKKFNIMEKRTNYKLDTIAFTHLGAGKLEYDCTIHEFWRRDMANYIEYNRIDVERVYQLDLVLNYINLARTLCNIGLVEYSCIYKSAPYIYGALTVQARSEGRLLLSSTPESLNSNADDYAGGYVKNAQAGLYLDGIASYDLNSLYPSIIRTLNISPETKVGRVIDDDDPNEIVFRYETGNMEYFTAKEFEAFERRYIKAANGVYYVQHEELHGILPKWCARLYALRTSTRATQKEHKDSVMRLQNELDEDGTTNQRKKEIKSEMTTLSALIDILESTQHAIKIVINTAYGVIGSAFFQLYDIENAEAITTSGQYIIQCADGFINKYIRHKYKNAPSVVADPLEQTDRIVYGDTDSVSQDTRIQTLRHTIDSSSAVKETMRIDDLFEAYLID